MNSLPLHADSPPQPDSRPFPVFLTVWAGQAASLLGSKLSSFALGVWVFQETGLVSWLAGLMLAATLPGLLIAPLAGAVVDRTSRRRLMLLADTVSGVTTLCLAAAIWLGGLNVWMIVPAAILLSLADAFQTPAYMAYVPQLVRPAQLDRANGLVQLAAALGTVGAPALAGWLLAWHGLWLVLLVDVATFGCAVATLLFAPPVAEKARTASGDAWRDARIGWAYVLRRPGLLGMLLVFAVANLAMAFANVLFIPLLLPLAGEAGMGIVLSVAGVGMILGSVAVVARGLPQPRIVVMLACLLVGGAAMTLSGVFPDARLVALFAFLLMAVVPAVNTAVYGVLQTRVPDRLQGRVQSLRRMLMQAAAPLAYVAAGPLADRVFEPAMRSGGWLAERIGETIGTGDGRGAAVLFILCGLLVIGVALLGWLSPAIRRVEQRGR